MEGPDSNVAGSEVNDYSWTELQRAMGATDEEMAILQNFGSNSSRDGQDVASENHLELLDLDCRQNTNCDQVIYFVAVTIYFIHVRSNNEYNIYDHRKKLIPKSMAVN